MAVSAPLFLLLEDAPVVAAAPPRPLKTVPAAFVLAAPSAGVADDPAEADVIVAVTFGGDGS